MNKGYHKYRLAEYRRSKYRLIWCREPLEESTIPNSNASHFNQHFNTGQILDTIIEALGGSTESTLEKKRLRLRRLVGLVPVPLA